MIDIHSHLIPNVDDGSKSMDVSIGMVKKEIENGVDEVICTPHFYYHRYETPLETILQKYNELKEEVKNKNLPIQLYLGMEICYTTKIDLLKLLEEKRILTLANTDYVLLEFSMHHAPEEIADVIYAFSLKGYQVIVAHVERYPWMNKQIIETLLNEGALIQVNADSVVGKNGLKAWLFTHSLLKKGKVNFIASDVHSFRENCMKEAMKKYGKYLNEVNLFEKGETK